VVAVVIQVGSVAAASIWKAQPSAFLTEVYVAAASDDTPAAHVQAALGLFSPREAAYTITSADDDVTLRAGRSVTVPPDQFPIQYNDGVVIKDLRVRANDVRAFLGDGLVMEKQPPQAQVRVTAKGLNITVTPGHALQDGFIKYNRFVLPIGDIQAGTQWQATGLAESTRQFTSHMVHGGVDEVRAHLRQMFFPEPVFEVGRTLSFDQLRYLTHFRGTEPGPVVFGWSDEPQLPIASIEPTTPRRAVGLWAIAAKATFEGPQLFLPKGVMALEVKNKSAVAMEVGEGQFVGTRPAQLELEFALPQGCPALQAEEATFYLEFRGSAFQPRVRIAPAAEAGKQGANSARWQPLSGGPEYRIPQPQRFFQTATGKLTILVDVGVADASSRTSENVLLGLSSWQIRECDLALKGVTR
jgi:hypothetical protein